MKLTIEVERVDGKLRAKLLRGSRTFERELDAAAERSLLRLTDRIEAPPQRQRSYRSLHARIRDVMDLAARVPELTAKLVSAELEVCRPYALDLLRVLAARGELVLLSRERQFEPARYRRRLMPSACAVRP